MPEPFSAERLNQLRQRWERDPKSRAFLQLAEEYRRGGRLADAVQVLEAGLKEHPNYLSAQVALGRCHLENGTPGPAIELLERAVARDPTQLVANKLLVEAYLGIGQASKARERLDLYKLFNDRDVEIEGLEARIRELSGGAAPAGSLRRVAEAPRRSPAPPALFDLPPVGALPEVRLGPHSAPPRPAAHTADSEPFGRIHSPTAVQRIQSALADEGIFALASAPAAPAVAVLPEPSLPVQNLPVPSLPEPGLPEESAYEPPPATPDVQEPASATLGELYLTQGHLDEAEESFRSVLRGRPGDAVALAGLDAVREQRGEGAEAFAGDEAIVAEESHLIVGGLTARKASLLRDYLERIRRGAKRHVS